MTQIDPTTVTALQKVVSQLRDSAPLSDSGRKALYESYAKDSLQKMLDTGASYGEATGAPGVALAIQNEEEFRAHLRVIDNDLAAQVNIVSEGTDHYFRHGEAPPPYYAWRIAVILRKHKRYDLEAEFLEAFSKHFRKELGGRYAAIAERAPKARRLAETARGTIG